MKTINSFTTVVGGGGGGVGGSENDQRYRAHSLTLTMKLYLSIETAVLRSLYFYTYNIEEPLV